MTMFGFGRQNGANDGPTPPSRSSSHRQSTRTCSVAVPGVVAPPRTTAVSDMTAARAGSSGRGLETGNFGHELRRSDSNGSRRRIKRQAPPPPSLVMICIFLFVKSLTVKIYWFLSNIGML